MTIENSYEKPANTFIGPGVTVRADNLSGAESVRIDGLFSGNIDLDGYLQVGEAGRIEGNIKVSYAIIAGEILGDILCRAAIHLSETAKVCGDITTGSIIIDKGAAFYGRCNTRDDAPETAVV
jgi:cytoskeletal protein CcmA (bactofilin family)